MDETLWVIIRSTGEYSDRIETPIRYCRTEEEAQWAVELAGIEAQRDAHLKPTYPDMESTHEWVHSSGKPITWYWASRMEGSRFVRKANADDIDRKNKEDEAQYDAACLAMGHVDPEGSWRGDSYYYAPVTPLTLTAAPLS